MRKEANSSLELKFEVDQKGRLEGTSVTNFFSQDRTKSRIVGQVDFERERLSFREVENLFTRSDADEQEFCYVQVPDMSWKEEGSKAVYEGRFVGYFPDSSTCAEGTIILASPEMLERVIKESKKIRKILDWCLWPKTRNQRICFQLKKSLFVLSLRPAK